VIDQISHDRRLLAKVAAHHTGCVAAGWRGVVMMCLGVTTMPSPLGTVMFWVGTPMAGLGVWLRRDDDHGEGGGDDPDVPPVDWDEFERSFWARPRAIAQARPARARSKRVCPR
jgi:hypothetical protein